jgi:hypothetical protein
MVMKKILAWVLFVLLAVTSAQAVDRTWTGGTDANWGSAGNWNTGVPVIGDRAWFNSASPVTTNVTLGTETLDYGAATPTSLLYFNSAHNYTLNGGTLTLTGTSTVNTDVMNIGAGAAGTTQTFNSGLILNLGAGGQRIATAATGHYVFNGNVAFQKSATVRLLDLNSTATFNGGVDVSAGAVINFLGGTIHLKSKMQGAGPVVMQGQGRDTSVILNNASGAAFDFSLSRVYFGGGTDTGYDTTIRLDADDQVDGAVTLGVNATWDLNGRDNRNTGVLSMVAPGYACTVDFSDPAAEALWIANSSAQTWNTEILNLAGFDFDTDEIRFGTDATGLTTNQLGQIRIDGALVHNKT